MTRWKEINHSLRPILSTRTLFITIDDDMPFNEDDNVDEDELSGRWFFRWLESLSLSCMFINNHHVGSCCVMIVYNTSWCWVNYIIFSTAKDHMQQISWSIWNIIHILTWNPQSSFISIISSQVETEWLVCFLLIGCVNFARHLRTLNGKPLSGQMAWSYLKLNLLTWVCLNFSFVQICICICDHTFTFQFVFPDCQLKFFQLVPGFEVLWHCVQNVGRVSADGFRIFIISDFTPPTAMAADILTFSPLASFLPRSSPSFTF